MGEGSTKCLETSGTGVDTHIGMIILIQHLFVFVPLVEYQVRNGPQAIETSSVEQQKEVGIKVEELLFKDKRTKVQVVDEVAVRKRYRGEDHSEDIREELICE